MLRKSWFVLAALTALGLAAPAALAQKTKLIHREGDDEPKQQEKAEKGGDKAASGAKCPVMTDKPIDKKHVVKYKGKDVYFCCGKCKAKFEKDAAPYEEAVKAQWAAMQPPYVQVTCPGEGKPIDKAVFLKTKDHGEVYFCCKDCKAAWEKDKGKAMSAKLESCRSYQTKCPIGGEDIDPAVSLVQGGKTIYFCCKDCIDKYKAEPDKYGAAVDEQIAKNKAAAEEAKQAAAKEKEEKKKGGG